MLPMEQLQLNAQKFIPPSTKEQAKEKYNDSKAWWNFVGACRSDYIKSLKHKEQKEICPICCNFIDLTIEWKDDVRWSSVLHHTSYFHNCFNNTNDFNYLKDDCKTNFLHYDTINKRAFFPEEYNHPCKECIKNLVLVHAYCHIKIHGEQVKMIQKNAKKKVINENLN